jgi:hypothetical protein
LVLDRTPDNIIAFKQLTQLICSLKRSNGQLKPEITRSALRHFFPHHYRVRQFRPRLICDQQSPTPPCTICRVSPTTSSGKQTEFVVTQKHLLPFPHQPTACCDAGHLARPPFTTIRRRQQHRHVASPPSHPTRPRRARSLQQATTLLPARNRPIRPAAAQERRPSSRSRRRRTNYCRARARRRIRSTRTGPSGEILGRAAARSPLGLPR